MIGGLKVTKSSLRTPQEILNKIAALNAESAQELVVIRGLL